MKNKLFCENCRDFVDVKRDNCIKSIKIRGETIEYMSNECRCKICENLVFDSEQRDLDVKTISDMYLKSINGKNLTIK